MAPGDLPRADAGALDAAAPARFRGFGFLGFRDPTILGVPIIRITIYLGSIILGSPFWETTIDATAPARIKPGDIWGSPLQNPTRTIQ